MPVPSVGPGETFRPGRGGTLGHGSLVGMRPLSSKLIWTALADVSNVRAQRTTPETSRHRRGDVGLDLLVLFYSRGDLRRFQRGPTMTWLRVWGEPTLVAVLLVLFVVTSLRLPHWKASTARRVSIHSTSVK